MSEFVLFVGDPIDVVDEDALIGAIVSLGRNSCGGGGGGGVGSDLLLHGLNDSAFDDVHTDHHLDKDDDDDVSISVDDLLLTPQVSINLIFLMAALYIGHFDQIMRPQMN